MSNRINKLLLYEYTSVRLGEKDSMSNSFFSNGAKANHEAALSVYRYAFEIFLHWTPEEIAAYIDMEILELMNLKEVLKFIKFPPELNKEKDLDYIAHLLYPKRITYNPEKLVIRTYKDVLEGKLYKFPKKYFDGIDGKRRACICLTYMIEQENLFRSAKEGYKFFASSEGKKQLNNNAFKLVWKNVFLSPVSFYHESLPDDKKDEFWYHYYEMLYQHADELSRMRGENV